MKYEFFTKHDEKTNTDVERVKFPEHGIDFLIEEDNEGHKYFKVPNKIASNRIEKMIFKTEAIKDAFDLVKDGEADAILTQKTIFSNTIIKVIKYVDEEYGKEIRAKFLEEWSKMEFGWTIVVDSVYGLSPRMYLCNELSSLTKDLDDIVFYTDMCQAVDLFHSIVKESRSIAEKVIEMNNQEDQIEYFKDIQSRFGKESVYLFTIPSEFEFLQGVEKSLELKIIQIARRRKS